MKENIKKMLPVIATIIILLIVIGILAFICIMDQNGKEVTNDPASYWNATGQMTEIQSYVGKGSGGGYTRWILTIETNNTTVKILAKAEDLNLITIEKVLELRGGEMVTALITEKNELVAIRVS